MLNVKRKKIRTFFVEISSKKCNNVSKTSFTKYLQACSLIFKNKCKTIIKKKIFEKEVEILKILASNFFLEHDVTSIIVVKGCKIRDFHTVLSQIIMKFVGTFDYKNFRVHSLLTNAKEFGRVEFNFESMVKRIKSIK